jgi:hypothetical protein
MADQGSPNVPKFERDEDFASLYANNIWYESSAWDLRLLFGQLDQSKGPNVVAQHTAIALSWLQVKLMIYYLQINLALHEVQNGRVAIPASVMPPEPEPLTSELQDDPLAKTTREIVVKLRQQLTGNL